MNPREIISVLCVIPFRWTRALRSSYKYITIGTILLYHNLDRFNVIWYVHARYPVFAFVISSIKITIGDVIKLRRKRRDIVIVLVLVHVYVFITL